MNAERAYLFRHALLRDAARQLQLPGDRARLHALAFSVIEELAGGRPPEPAPLGATEESQFQPHPGDAFAEELAEHARLADSAAGEDGAALRGSRRLYLRRAAECAEREFQSEAAERLWREHAETVTGVEKGESLRRGGIVAAKAGRPKVAEILFAQALALHRDTGNRWFEGIALENLANLTKRIRIGESERLFQQALSIHRETGNRRAEGTAIGNLATLSLETGNVAAAEEGFQQALRIHRAVGNRRFEGIILGNLAILYRQTGRHELAEEAYQQAIALNRQIGERAIVAANLCNLATLYRLTGRNEAAARAGEEALVICREIGDQLTLGLALENVAALHASAGRMDQVEPLLHQVLHLYRQAGDRRGEGIAAGILAEFHAGTGNPGLARKGYEEALAIDREVRNRRFEGMHLCAYALLQLDRPGTARETWLAGEAILRELKDASALEQNALEMRSACSAAGITTFEAKSIRT